MKFTCSSKDLLNAVQTASRVMAAHSPMELLEGIRIDAYEGYITLTASDGNMTSVTRVDANVEIDGAVVLPGRLLGDVVRKIPEGTVSASLSKSFVVTFRCAGSRTNISGKNAESYPMPAALDANYEISLPQLMLKDMIQKVSFAVPLEDSRKVLTGGFLNIQNGIVDLVGLDGFRMAMRTQRISDTEKNAKAIIPVKALDEIARLMGDDEEKNVRLSFNQNRLMAEAGDTVLYSALIEGQYIDYKRVIPKAFNVCAKVDRESFCGCIERTALIARESKNNLVRFDIKEGELVLTASSEVGDVREELDAEITGSDLAISFNVRYMSEIIKVISGDSVNISFGTSVSPCVFTPADGDGFTYLVLPVRTNA